MRQFSLEVFQHGVISLPVLPATIALFIAYLFDHKYAPATVNTYISAIGYYHRLASFPDPSKVAYIVEMLKGYGKLGRTIDSRLPITLPILNRLIQASRNICASCYERAMFQAMCSLAFFAFLRIGEITVTRGPPDSHILQTNQLFKVLGPDKQIVSLKVVFNNFKHHYNQPPLSITISKQHAVCPVQLMLEYLAVRGSHPGTLFITSEGNPVSRSQFSKLLNSCIKACSLDPSRYKGHSFRIGAATYAAQQGFSDAKIRVLGRWKSDAFKRYIRVQSVVSL